MQHLILLGAGHAHLHVLSTLAAHPLPGVQITLVAPYPQPLYDAMVPGFIAGHYTLADCMIPLAPLLENTGIRWLARRASALDGSTRSLTLDDGSIAGLRLAVHQHRHGARPPEDGNPHARRGRTRLVHAPAGTLYYSAQGRWVGWLKGWLDRRFMKRYRKA